MPDLQTRLAEVMAVTGWEHADIVRVSGQSHSVVSQWLGKTKRPVKRITKIGAVIRMSKASGFAAEWLAEGTGRKRDDGTMPPDGRPIRVAETSPGYGVLQQLDELERVLQQVPAEQRDAVATNLAGWARDGGAPHWKPALLALLALPGAARKRA